MYFFKDRFKNTHNNDATIGLDIGTTVIKWVSLDHNNELKQCAIQAIPTPIASTETKEITKIATILKRTLLEQDFIKNCIVNIPDVLVCTKWVQIDHQDCQRIEATIELLIEKSIPYPLNKLCFDYQIFEQLPESQEKCKVLIVACRKEHVDFRLNIIKQANLIPLAVEVSSFALERAYGFFYPNKTNGNTILLDIGACQIAALFFNDVHTTVYCENLISISDQESVLLEIKRCIKKYALAYPHRILRELVLIGADNALLSYLLNKLDGFLALRVETLKHHHQTNYRSKLNIDKLKKNFLNVFLSYGLALR